MSDDSLYRQWLEQSWRRPLSPSEQADLRAWLAAHPKFQADWETESGLNSVLEHLPPAPVASNFTARVLQSIEREQNDARHQGRRAAGWWHWRWLPRAAFAVALGSVGLVSAHHLFDVRQERVRYARSAEALAQVATLPNAAILENFDAIRALDQTPGPDEELLKLLE